MRMLKKILFKSKIIWGLYQKVKNIKINKLKVRNKGYIRIKKCIQGTGLELIVGDNTVLNDTSIHMIGNNNKIIFGNNCNVGTGCSFWVEGNNVTINIGDGTTFTTRCHLNAQEDNMSIIVGKDCMFSNHIIVRTSDSHPIYDNKTSERINSAKSVEIGDHVWIAPHSTVMKGVHIANNCIIGSQTLVTKDIPESSLAVGYPAKVVKSNINWTREDIIFNKQNG